MDVGTVNELKVQLEIIDKIEASGVPTRMVGNKERPVNLAVHKRKLRKQATKEHEQALLERLVAVLIEAGYLQAKGVMQFGVFAIHRDGFQVEEEI